MDLIFQKLWNLRCLRNFALSGSRVAASNLWSGTIFIYPPTLPPSGPLGQRDRTIKNISIISNSRYAIGHHLLKLCSRTRFEGMGHSRTTRKSQWESCRGWVVVLHLQVEKWLTVEPFPAASLTVGGRVDGICHRLMFDSELGTSMRPFRNSHAK